MNRLPGDFGKPVFSNLCPFRQRQGIIDIYAKVSDGIFDVGMAEQDVHCSKFACGFLDQHRERIELPLGIHLARWHDNYPFLI